MLRVTVEGRPEGEVVGLMVVLGAGWMGTGWLVEREAEEEGDGRKGEAAVVWSTFSQGPLPWTIKQGKFCTTS